MGYKLHLGYSSEETYNVFTEIMSSKTPFFFGRIGGSDYNTVNQYFNNPKLYSTEKASILATKHVKNYNGYFDFDYSHSNFIKYLDKMLY